MRIPKPTFLVYLIIVIFAVISGMSDYAFLHSLATFISNIFMKIFRCISLPILSLSVVVALVHSTPGGKLKNIWQNTLFYTILTTLLAAIVAATLFVLIAPENINKVSGIEPVSVNGNYFEYLVGIIPGNLFEPFLQHQVVSALLVSVVVGLAIRRIADDEARILVVKFFRGIHSLLMVITGWIVKLLPIAMFGFITIVVLELKGGMDFSGLRGYLSVVVASNIIQGFVVLPVFLVLHKIKPWKAMRGALPALSVAFFSKSSTGTMPMTIEVAEKNLGVSPLVSRFVLPLCTSINMNGCAAFIFTTVVYLMQNHGIAISFGTIALWVVISVLAAIGNAGVPMGCFFLSASLLTSMNVPIALMGVILPFYSVIDMIETSLNVWSDICVAKVISDKAGESAPASE